MKAIAAFFNDFICSYEVIVYICDNLLNLFESVTSMFIKY